jgi:DNA-binding Lrp family transcriptional regulator
MPTAYVFINTEIGSESNVLEELKKIEGVEEAHALWGVYDIIASIKADTINKLVSIITKQIENIEKVTAKLTMVITESPIAQANHEAVLFGTAPV